MRDTAISGAGINGVQPAVRGNLTINQKNPYVGMAARKAENKTKKPLNYNHREISGQLLRAKKAQSAGTVLTRAKARLATLQRAAGSGQYDEKEMENAIAHARRMVRCAQMKVRNLKEEEREQNVHRKENGNREQSRRSEIKRRMAQKERQLESKIMAEEMQNVQQEKSRRQEMVRKRRLHRNTEQEKITEADMKFLKGQMENQKDGSSTANTFDSGVFVELSASAQALAETQMMQEQTQEQLEAEIEAELGMELGAEMSGAGTAAPGAAPLPAMGTSAASSPEISGGFSISV